MEPKRQVRTERHPETEKTEKLDALLKEVAEDAHQRGESYPEETLVPEGGE